MADIEHKCVSMQATKGNAFHNAPNKQRLLFYLHFSFIVFFFKTENWLNKTISANDYIIWYMGLDRRLHGNVQVQLTQFSLSDSVTALRVCCAQLSWDTRVTNAICGEFHAGLKSRRPKAISRFCIMITSKLNRFNKYWVIHLLHTSLQY